MNDLRTRLISAFPRRVRLWPTSFKASLRRVVLGTESRGSLLGPLAATHLGIGIGFAEVRKGAERRQVARRWPVRSS